MSLDEYAMGAGFRDADEMHQLIAKVDVSSPDKRKRFTEWKHTDGTKHGLIALDQTEKPSASRLRDIEASMRDLPAEKAQVSLAIEEMVKTMLGLAAKCREQERTIENMEGQGTVSDVLLSKLVSAKKRIEYLNVAFTEAMEKLVESERDNSKLQKMTRDQHDQLEGARRALADADPEHPLVGGSAPALSQTELRFIFACLSLAEDRLSSFGCSDWSIVNPDKDTLDFMLSVVEFDDCEPLEHRKDGTVDGPSSTLVPAYLRARLMLVYGDIFDEHAGLIG